RGLVENRHVRTAGPDVVGGRQPADTTSHYRHVRHITRVPDPPSHPACGVLCRNCVPIVISCCNPPLPGSVTLTPTHRGGLMRRITGAFVAVLAAGLFTACGLGAGGDDSAADEEAASALE